MVMPPITEKKRQQFRPVADYHNALSSFSPLSPVNHRSISVLCNLYLLGPRKQTAGRVHQVRRPPSRRIFSICRRKGQPCVAVDCYKASPAMEASGASYFHKLEKYIIVIH